MNQVLEFMTNVILRPVLCLLWSESGAELLQHRLVWFHTRNNPKLIKIVNKVRTFARLDQKCLRWDRKKSARIRNKDWDTTTLSSSRSINRSMNCPVVGLGVVWIMLITQTSVWNQTETNLLKLVSVWLLWSTPKYNY